MPNLGLTSSLSLSLQGGRAAAAVPGPPEHCQAGGGAAGLGAHLHRHGIPQGIFLYIYPFISLLIIWYLPVGRRAAAADPSEAAVRRGAGGAHHGQAHVGRQLHALPGRRPQGPQAGGQYHLRWTSYQGCLIIGERAGPRVRECSLTQPGEARFWVNA